MRQRRQLRFRLWRTSGSPAPKVSVPFFLGHAVYEGDLGEFLPYLNAAVWTAIGRHTVYLSRNGLPNCLLGGHSILMRALTGAGKTWATVAPLLYSLAWRRRIADGLLYVLPDHAERYK